MIKQALGLRVTRTWDFAMSQNLIDLAKIENWEMPNALSNPPPRCFLSPKSGELRNGAKKTPLLARGQKRQILKLGGGN